MHRFLSRVLNCKIGARCAPATVNSQPPNHPHHQHGPERVKRVEVYWHAVSYKSLTVYSLVLVALIFGSAYFVTPGFYAAVLKKVSSAVSGSDGDVLPLAVTQIKFVNLDGRVQVETVNSVQC